MTKFATTLITKKRNAVTKRKVFAILGALVLAFSMFALFSFAADNVSMSGIVQNIVDKVIKPVFIAIGVLLLAWGVGMLVLAFKNEDAESKSRAMMLIAVSVALVGIGSFITSIVGGLYSTIGA